MVVHYSLRSQIYAKIGQRKLMYLDQIHQLFLTNFFAYKYIVFGVLNIAC